MIGMASELEKIEEVKKYIEATIAEIDSHTENMEKLFKMDKWSSDRELYEIIINSYERHRNTLKRIQKMVEGGKVESGLYTLSTKSEIDMVKERVKKLENEAPNIKLITLAPEPGHFEKLKNYDVDFIIGSNHFLETEYQSPIGLSFDEHFDSLLIYRWFFSV